MPRLSVISSGLLLTLLLVALCNVAAVPARLSHLVSPSTGAAVDMALVESSVKSFKACNLGDSKCTGYQAFGFCCPAGSCRPVATDLACTRAAAWAATASREISGLRRASRITSFI
jgi:hypothetical protein